MSPFMVLKDSGLSAATRASTTSMSPLTVWTSVFPETFLRVTGPLMLLMSISPLTPSTTTAPSMEDRISSDDATGTWMTRSVAAFQDWVLIWTTLSSSSTSRPEVDPESCFMPAIFFSFSSRAFWRPRRTGRRGRRSGRSCARDPLGQRFLVGQRGRELALRPPSGRAR